jgi:hypothetical protein
MLTLVQAIVQTFLAKENCILNVNEEWEQKHEKRLKELEKLLPSGSGFDSGTSIVSCSDAKLVLKTSFHHMNENGYYDGWTDHYVTVTPSFSFGLDIRVSGRNRNDIKDFILDEFYYALLQEV